MGTFIDNVTTLAVERCLLDDLENIISPESIAGLDDEELADLGGESSTICEERAKALALVVLLEDVRRICRGEGKRAPQVLEVVLGSPPAAKDLSFRFSDLSMRIGDVTVGMPTPPERPKPSGHGIFSSGLLTPERTLGRRTPSPSSGGRKLL